jgi:N-acetylglutamate synthase-like GNAT family acetyltransferase
MDITIEQLTAQHPYYSQVYDLREEVLRKPIGLSLEDEDLSTEELDTTLVALHSGKVIGCLMLHAMNDPAVMRLRQMAVSPSWQGKGIGRRLIMAAEERLRQKQIGRIILYARVTVTGFYGKLGYTVASDTFTEVGIPHIVMVKQLQ